MSDNTVTLDFIKTELEKRYAPFIVEGVPGGDVRMLPALRLPGEQRKKLLSLQTEVEKIQDVGEDGEVDVDRLISMLAEMVAVVTDSEEAAARLQDALGDDPAAYELVFSMYSQATQSGEASPSES